ncbi:hypothetical protein Tco_0579674 [Tanacetum coccineum]
MFVPRYPHSDVSSSTRGTKTRGKAHYGLRSLGPVQEAIVLVKQPYGMVKVTNVVLGLRAQKEGVGCSGVTESDLDTFPDGSDDSKEDDSKEVVFKIHTKGYFEYDPLRYVEEDKWALFYRKPKKSLEKGLKLLHTDNDVHSFFEATVKNGFIHLYIAHKKQILGKYYYKNMKWEEEDADLRCSSSTLFTTRYKRKVSKSNMVGLRKKVKACVIHDEVAEIKTNKTLVGGGNKGKEKVCEDEGMCSKGNKPVVTIYKRAIVNGKAKMVEDVGAAKRGRDRGVVITEGAFNNVGGKEEVVSKRGIRSRKMQGSSVKVESE